MKNSSGKLAAILAAGKMLAALAKTNLVAC